MQMLTVSITKWLLLKRIDHRGTGKHSGKCEENEPPKQKGYTVFRLWLGLSSRIWSWMSGWTQPTVRSGSFIRTSMKFTFDCLRVKKWVRILTLAWIQNRKYTGSNWEWLKIWKTRKNEWNSEFSEFLTMAVPPQKEKEMQIKVLKSFRSVFEWF